MSFTPREIGTLIVVVLKANHLPNKRHIGKQNPYCVVTINGENRRTRAIKRGGQHPEWDEEIRFTLYEDDDCLAPTSFDAYTPPPLPPKERNGAVQIKGGTMMKMACYADDLREPDFIGETEVDLTEVLTTGETDEWFTLMNKDKFAGKVYLELTFFSNEEPPSKPALKTQTTNKQYAGPGTFVPSDQGGPMIDPLRDDSTPASLRASNAGVRLDLYVAPYESRSHGSTLDNFANDFGELSMRDSSRRRESFPPPGTYHSRPTASYSYSGSIANYTAHAHHSVSDLSYNSTSQYHAPYESSASSTFQQPTARGPRHSVPTSSSGFVPISTGPSGFLSQPSNDLGHFIPPTSHTPTPYTPAASYQPSVISAPPPGPYLAPSTLFQPSTTPAPYAASTITTSQSLPHPSYSHVALPSVTSQPYVNTASIASAAVTVNSTNHLGYPYEYTAAATSPHDIVASQPAQAPSRPLPQPQLYSQGLSSPSNTRPSPHIHNSIQAFAISPSFQGIPPPPLPQVQYVAVPPPLPSHMSQVHGTLPLPPPPLPPLSNSPSPQRRQSSLPPPPTDYQQQPYTTPPPPLTHQHTSYHTHDGQAQYAQQSAYGY